MRRATWRLRCVLMSAVAVLAVGAALVTLLYPRSDQREHYLSEAAAATESASGASLSDSSGQVEPKRDVVRPAERRPGSKSGAADAWVERFRHGSDYYALAHDLARAATSGNTKAQYYLGQVLLECEVQVGLISPMPGRSIDEKVDAYLAPYPGMRENHQRRIRRDALRCARFFDTGGLGARPLPEEVGARGHQFWLDQALSASEPLAVMDRARSSTSAWDASNTDEERAAMREALPQDVHVAVASREPAAIARIGWLYSNHEVAADHMLQGAAWLIAACEMGYECSFTNPEIAGGCEIAAGTCRGDLTILDVLQRDYGPRQYAEAYAASQDIRHKIEIGDWAGLQQYLQTKN